MRGDMDVVGAAPTSDRIQKDQGPIERNAFHVGTGILAGVSNEVGEVG